MKTGDWVRFCTEEIHPMQRNLPNWKYGLLVEYQPWEKIARILYEGQMVSVRAEQAQLVSRGYENI